MPLKHLGRRALGLVLAALLIYGGMLPPVRNYFTLPQVQRVTSIELKQLDWGLPASLARQVETQVNNIDKINSQTNTDPDWLQLQLRLFGIIPLKNIMLQVVEPVKVYPGGQAIGVLLKTEGVKVVGQAPIINNRGSYQGEETGLKVGDNIVAINGQEVKSNQQVAKLIDAAGKTGSQVQITVKRNKRLLTLNVSPFYCEETDRYRVGIYVRDSTAGVGTLTFYDQEKNIFGALGHLVTGSDQKEAINVNGGQIVPAAIQGIHLGRQGHPGEKIGVFLENSSFNGIIEKNTGVGIFGTMTSNISSLFDTILPVAMVEEVRPGPAEIMTVIEGEKVERFSIEIERVMAYQRASGKGLIIRITDPKLLSTAGGIVQGMSGSPIIQNGSLVGAVTHVFINEPNKGYGVLAEWMLQETDLTSLSVYAVITRGFTSKSPGFNNYLMIIVK